MRLVLGEVRRTHPSRGASRGIFVAHSTLLTEEKPDCNGGNVAAFKHVGSRNGRTNGLSPTDSELHVVDVDGHCSTGMR